MTRIVAIGLCAVLLAACQDADAFRGGSSTDGVVQLDAYDKCVVWVSVYNPRVGPDVGIHARIISPECNK